MNLYPYTKQGIRERFLSLQLRKGQPRYLSVVTPMERRVLEILQAEGKLNVTMGHRQAWIEGV